jgi:hypothetical protein
MVDAGTTLPASSLIRQRSWVLGYPPWLGEGSVEMLSACVAGASAVVSGLTFSTGSCSVRNSELWGSGASFGSAAMPSRLRPAPSIRHLNQGALLHSGKGRARSGSKQHDRLYKPRRFL